MSGHEFDEDLAAVRDLAGELGIQAQPVASDSEVYEWILSRAKAASPQSSGPHRVWFLAAGAAAAAVVVFALVFSRGQSTPPPSAGPAVSAQPASEAPSPQPSATRNPVKAPAGLTHLIERSDAIVLVQPDPDHPGRPARILEFLKGGDQPPLVVTSTDLARRHLVFLRDGRMIATFVQAGDGDLFRIADGSALVELLSLDALRVTLGGQD